MKLSRSLAARIVGVAFVSGIAGILLTRGATNVAATHAVVDGLRAHFAAGELQRCEADPRSFSVHFGAGFRAFAYDPSTGVSLSPDAPPLPADLAQRVPHMDPGESGFAIKHANPWRGNRTLLLRVADRGPCALVLATWPTRLLTMRLARGLGASVLLTALLSAAFGLLVVVRPLGRRLEALSAQADALGRDRDDASDRSGPVAIEPAAKAEGDELDVVASALGRAAARIRDDADELSTRAETLERHLEEVAHDLRTPLASLQLAVEQARGAVSEGSEAAGHLEDALRGAVFLDALIGDLRDAARLEGGWRPNHTTDPERAEAPHDLVKSVDHVVRRAVVLARGREVVVEHAVPDEPVHVACDPLACERVLENLLVNAIEHGARGGHVALTLRTLAPEHARFVIDLFDQGPGLVVWPPAPPKRRGERARGRGLHVVATLLDALGWTLTLEPAEEGTHVRIEGPAVVG